MTEPMQPRVSDIYDIERWGYDSGSKIWTFITGILLAAVVDWIEVVMPVRNHPPHDPHVAGWIVGMIVALLAPGSWLVGRLTRKDWNGVVMWTMATVAAVVFQLVVIVWARNYT